MFNFSKKKTEDLENPPEEILGDEGSSGGSEAPKEKEPKRTKQFSFNFNWLSPVLSIVLPGIIVFAVMLMYWKYLSFRWFFTYDHPERILLFVPVFSIGWLITRCWFFLLVKVGDYLKKDSEEDSDESYIMYIWNFNKFPLKSFINSFVLKRKPDQIVSIERFGKVNRIFTMSGEKLTKKSDFIQDKKEFRKGGGLAWKFPMIETFRIADGSKRTFDPEPFYAISKDGKPLFMKILFLAQISDIYAYFYGIDDSEKVVESLTQGLCRNFVGNHNFEEINSFLEKQSKEILDDLQKASEEWGLDIPEFRIKGVAPAGKDFEEAISRGAGAVAEAAQKVEAAKKEAEAIETIAKAKANALKIMREEVGGNAEAMHLLELQTAERVAGEINSLNIIGDSITSAVAGMTKGGVVGRSILVEK